MWRFISHYIPVFSKLSQSVSLRKCENVEHSNKTSVWRGLVSYILKLVTLITDYTDGDFCIRKMESFAAQLRQSTENSLVLCHLKTSRLYTVPFMFELDHYLTNVARVKSTYWGWPILYINWSHDVSVTWYSWIIP